MPDALVEGRDYVVEHGLFVFTREYLLRRGYCCGNRCRNCPYAEEADESEMESVEKPPNPTEGTE